MPALFTPTAHPLAIAPNQYASANKVPRRDDRIPPTVRFTPSHSSICIVAPDVHYERAIGIHIPMMVDDYNFFSIADVPTVKALLNGMSEERFILGAVKLWKANLPEAYAALASALDYPQTYDHGPGVYAAGYGSAGLEVLYSH
ncbi:hypothetical protein [Lysobacter enzymogenes]|uniref:hypothetical protein n=1 Tax=Lysobacter enzymogenes TaxID=69 RepID=UPI000894D877|nr:hypothetical protein [Lysobacter enzymogenes]SDX87304.1 hypothetical protein SAMN05421681_108264 [Lysobacter enzymogenes]